MKNIFAVLAVIGVIGALATPASAESFRASDGTGNVLPFSHKGAKPHKNVVTFGDAALGAFASGPGVIDGASAPAVTGGGSPGYNELLRNY
jgi:hypothetical protein